MLIPTPKPTRWRQILATAITLVALASPTTQAQNAQTFDFKQAPTSLGDALERLSLTTGIDVIVSSKLVAGKPAPALNGSYSAQAALARLLAGSGLVHEFTAPDAVIVVAPSASGRGSQGDETMPEVVVTAGAPSYLPQAPQSVSRLGIPPRDQVQTVNTVTAKEIADRGATSVLKALESVPGLRPSPSVYSGSDSSLGYVSRGFSNQFTYINGLRVQGLDYPIDITTVDRADVLKGPAGVLFGQGDPGGTLNVVTKKPQAQAFNELGFTYGSFDFYRATLDSTGVLLSRPGTTPTASPLTAKGAKEVQPVTAAAEPVLLYRLNAAYQNNESYRDFVDEERYLIAPSVTWIISEDTKLNVEFQYFREEFIADRGLPTDPASLKAARNLFVGEPDMPHSTTETYNAMLQFEHRLSDNWTFRQNTAFFYQDLENYEIGTSGTPVPGTSSLFNRYASKSWGENTFLTLQFELHGQFNTGSVAHTTVLGAEYAYRDFSYGFLDPATPIGPIDIYNPKYGTFNFSGPYTTSWAPEGYGDDSYGVYFDHQVKFNDQWRLLLGSRYDWSYGFYYNADTGAEYGASDSHAWSPRAGLVWSPLPSTDLYASYSRTFKPNLFSDGAGNFFDPEIGEGYEAGFRQRFMDDRLQLTGSVFQIVKENILNADPDDPTGRTQILNGEERARGFEFELKGDLLPGLEVSAGYTYLDAEITESNEYPVGSALINAPENQANVFLRYEFQSGNLKGFFLGAGAFYADERLRASYANSTLVLPSQVRFDANVGWHNDQWRVQVNFENLTDEDLYESRAANVYPQAGFNVRASISYKF